MSLNRVMVCRICKSTYWFYGYELRQDPSVCRRCEQEATSNQGWSYKRKPDDPPVMFKS